MRDVRKGIRSKMVSEENGVGKMGLEGRERQVFSMLA